MGTADEQPYKVKSAVLWVDACVTKCLGSDKELFAPSVCKVLCVWVGAGGTAYGGTSGHMLFSALKDAQILSFLPGHPMISGPMSFVSIS